jgi:hypothetical protein
MKFLDPSQARVFPPPGSCIYCGALPSSIRLTDEHIVPYFLGGNTILREASCGPCADATKYVEGYCAYKIFHQFRVHERIQTRRPKNRPSTLPAILEFNHGDEQHELPVVNHPAVMVMPAYSLPGILTGAPPVDSWPEVRHRMFWNAANREKLKAEIIGQGGTAVRVEGTQRAALLPRLLAKIAHAYAVAELGQNAFHPSLLELIRNGQSIAPTG